MTVKTEMPQRIAKMNASNSQRATLKKDPKGQLVNLLLVANWDSDVGYAWWLMEGFWTILATEFSCRLAYPSISKIPKKIDQSQITVDQMDFVRCDMRSVIAQCTYLIRHKIKAIYFTDQASRHWRYLAFRLCGVRSIIVHDHTPGVRTVPFKLRRLIKHLLQRIPLYTCDAVFAVSDYIRERSIEVACIPAGRVHVVQNGIPDHTPRTADIYEEFGIPKDRKIIVSLGRASKYKGIQCALTSLAMLERRDWHYLVIGDGPDLEEFRHMAENLGIANHVTFAGKRSDAKDLLHCCYMAVHPSFGEAFSLAILEIMQAGLPLLVPDNPSVSGATDQNTGIIYSNSTSMTSGFEKILGTPDSAKKMGATAQEKVKMKYSLGNTHAQLLQAARTVILDGKISEPKVND